ncbi:hypothetical protein [Thiohalorhabdus denitrificans]|uniref:Uncharacterized protein n=1 Tax=Thiohalorhabdus denitrificans TaxID=381306 RepID=A0A1G5AAF7_9GAMM|nr:hypothetical protein [Thiohalorhabdus denitrificans]SCX74869.1 hypothetical protein SAMN05661077_0178 [Thiohalorhabdus denitrificans]
MSLLVVAHTDNPLARIFQVASLFLTYRQRQSQSGQPDAPLLGLWLDPSPLDTVTSLSEMGNGDPVRGPWVQESFGYEGDWYVCRLAANLGPQGDEQTLESLLNLLLEKRGAGGDPKRAFAPCFSSATPDQHILDVLKHFSRRYPDVLTMAVTQDPADKRLIPQPYLRANPT